MPRFSSANPRQKRLGRPLALPVVLGAALAFLAGCAAVPPYQQRRVSQPGMTFSDSLVENATSSLTPQIEPGSESAGGAQASGCSACR